MRTIVAGQWDGLGAPSAMPNRKTDTNNRGAFSSDNIGMNYDYPDGDYTTRAAIWKEHEQYQQGWCWFLANDDRVPQKIRDQVSKWGLAKDEFVDNGGWPHQLYVREARRMISDYVMTEHNCRGDRTVDDPVGLAAYTMDSHNVQRYVKDGYARNEGDVQVGGFAPYSISYKSIVPRRTECANLFVPVCLAASHIAYGSIRMEPVFMVLGQSAATAACLAIDDKVTVQQVDYKKLNARLLAEKQVLVWTGPKRGAANGIDPKSLKGIVVDDDKAKIVGDWGVSSVNPGYVGSQYLHDNNDTKGEKSVTFVIAVPAAGTYDVRLSYPPNMNRATNVPVTVQAGERGTEVKVNQRQKQPLEGGFVSLGKFTAEKEITVIIKTTGTDGHVIADAVMAVLVP